MHNHGWLYRATAWILVFQFLALISCIDLQAEPQHYSARFAKGDALRLTIWQPWTVSETGNRNTIDFNGDYIIDSRGYAFFPLLGEVKVVGHSTETLSEELKEKFGIYIQDPIVVVEPLIRVTTLGGFNRPGTHLISPEASLWELVDLAGGPADDADLSKFWIERGGQKIKVGLLSGFEKAYSLTEIGVQSGDQFFIANRSGITLRAVLDLTRFVISLVNLYLLIERTK